MKSDNALKLYHSKRDFRHTPEPQGRVTTTVGHRFVIQKHAARRLHFDFRLELDGVLKSWAVTRGPSLNPADKRLAVRTEDHPIEYRGFEGVIPQGYGAGTVMLWDYGDWEPLNEDPVAALEDGALKFRLKGERLQGTFALVRMKSKNTKRENWLLIKQRDEFSSDDFVATEEWDTSIRSDRTLQQIETQGKSYQPGKAYPIEKSARNRKPRPSGSKAVKEKSKLQFIPPQLATLRAQVPEGETWAHEIKYDGYRIQALIEQGEVRLLTRNKKDWTHRYPRVAEELRLLDVNQAILDGELVAVDRQGQSSFSALQNASEDSSIELVYYVFDLLHLNGKSLTGLTLLQRKDELRGTIGEGDGLVRFSDHIVGDGKQVIRKACAMHLEGIISKRISAPYRSGRGTSWVKTKCIGNDEFVIAGYRKSDKAGRPFASLILGEFSNGELLYRGRVGTGFDSHTLQQLAAKMSPLIRKTSALHEPPAEARDQAVWLRPQLVAQIAYTERTTEGRLRHPVFQGLREDKAAEQVTAADSVADSGANTKSDNKPTTVGGVRLTHPGRIMFPQQGVTKRAIAEYYLGNAGRVLPYLKNRPLSLLRCPEGREGECFFQKHHTASMPDALEKIDIKEKRGGHKPYLVIRNEKGLVASAQIGALELHLWGVRTDRLERPERLVFDLDPDESLPFRVVREAALELRDLLAVLELKSFALLTGGKGIHVVVPLVRRRGWDDAKAFSRGLAVKLANAAPNRYVATASKARRKGRIFIDWLRNERGATAIAPYSLRARENAPLAVPVGWDELKRVEHSHQYNLANISRRLDSLKRDPWQGYRQLRQSITQNALDSVNS